MSFVFFNIILSFLAYVFDGFLYIVSLTYSMINLSSLLFLHRNSYNFLDKSVGISTLFDISNQSLVDNISQVVETHVPLHIPGIDGLLIPSNTRGHILRLVDGNTALVRWEVYL